MPIGHEPAVAVRARPSVAVMTSTNPAAHAPHDPSLAHGHGHTHGPGHDHGHDHDHGHGSPADEDQSELLDLEASALAEHTASIAAWLPVEAHPRRIVDLGAGTGAGTIALLDQFPHARITAVDGSPAHLRRLSERVRAAGADDRVDTVTADLDDEWPDLGTADLVWASASLHHMADPDDTLRRIRDLLPAGGLFALVEIAGFHRFLPDGAPADRPGLEQRCHAVAERLHAERMPDLGTDWGPRLEGAGFTVTARRTVDIAVRPRPGDDTVGRYVLAGLRRLRDAVAQHVAPDDLAALDRLLDPTDAGFIANRDDLAVRTERTVWVARR